MKVIFLKDKQITQFLKDIRKDKRFTITDRSSETAIVMMGEEKVFQTLKARKDYWITRYNEKLFHIEIPTTGVKG